MPVKNRYEFNEATKKWDVFIKGIKVRSLDDEIEARSYLIRQTLNLNKEK